MSNRIQGDLRVIGTITADNNVPSDGSVTDAKIAAAAAISVDKINHQHFKSHSQPNTTATTETRILHVARSAGTVDEFAAGSIGIAVGAATVTVDLKKNGSSILSAVITLDTGNTTRVVETGTISGGTYAADDWFETIITATAGGGTLQTGVFVQGIFSEGPLP
jgi:hypothetical protein